MAQEVTESSGSDQYYVIGEDYCALEEAMQAYYIQKAVRDVQYCD